MALNMEKIKPLHLMSRREKVKEESIMEILEFECHLGLQVDSSNNVCSKWIMKIQTEQDKPHRKHTSIAQEFTVSFTIIIFSVTIVYIGRIRMHGV